MTASRTCSRPSGRALVEQVYRRSVAHRLLIELLACQFAFPVRWIETQDELFSRREAISRFVEFGPANVLAGMAKRTASTKYASKDLSCAVEREFLSSNQDVKRIYYEYEESAISLDADSTSSKQEVVAQASVPVQTVASTPTPQGVAAAIVPDVSLTAKEVVQSLVAQKLKENVQKVSDAKSIKELTGGKSTLQNELIGDLGQEFGNMPDAAEDLPLSAIGAALEPSFSGQLGKQSSSIIAQLISSKMPAGFNQVAIRDHVATNFGLGPARLSAVLLFAITAAPPSRLPSTEAAKAYINSVVADYAKSAGITLQSASSTSNTAAATVSINPAELTALRSEQQQFLSEQHKLLGKLLKHDPSGAEVAGQLQALHKECQDRLDSWCSEFSEKFEDLIKPRFDVKKGRRFDSIWNTVRENILRLYHRTEDEKSPLGQEELNKIYLQISNQSDDAVLDLIGRLAALALDNNGPDKGFAPIGFKLSAHVALTKHKRPVYKHLSDCKAPLTTVTTSGSIEYSEISRTSGNRLLSYPALLRYGSLQSTELRAKPYAHINVRKAGVWTMDTDLTETLLETYASGVDSGFSFAGKDVLLTGAGPGSIGVKVLEGLLMGGARVIVTTSREPFETAAFYQNLFFEHGARGSELLVLPFNQGSSRDCEALIDHIYSETGLGRNLDAIIPFAAMSEAGIDLSEVGAKSEHAHRMMMSNVLRLLGSTVKHKQQKDMNTRPTQVILPLSPNHGTFGGDGLYSESKLGLEGLLNRFESESWSDYLLVCGAVIGWTRGTGLMSGNNIVAQAIEARDVLTFSQDEMAFNVLGLMTPPIVRMCETRALRVHIDGGLTRLEAVSTILAQVRSQLNKEAEICRAIREEDAHAEDLIGKASSDMVKIDTNSARARSTLRIGFPSLPNFEQTLDPLRQLQGMVDLSNTVVVVGFSELGPWGNSRTRWEMETRGAFSQEGHIEMAWIMNLIKHVDYESKNGEHYVGWADAKTGEHIQDSEVGPKYGAQILAHSGIRLVEPDLHGGYDPEKKEYLQEVAVEEDLPEFDATAATADAFKLRHGENVKVRQIGSGEYRVTVKRGAIIRVPKSISSDGLVAGQIPTGWEPEKYGIPKDIVAQVDPATLYALCCFAEALYSAGIVDSLEIFKYVHLAELGNFIGSSMGGATKTRQMYKDRYLEKPVQGDVIQETYLNTAAAWANMILLGAAGPIKTFSGACATGVESLDSGCESLASGKTKMCFVGGYDDYLEDEAYAFGTIKATANYREELAKGRLPKEMSRPTAETRAGFVESHGSGIQIITTAELALEMGLPIYAVVAGSTMAADKIGRSVPAPGQGVLTFARETPDAADSPLLNLNYRREQMELYLSGMRSKVWTPSSSSDDASSQISDFISVKAASDLDAHVKIAQNVWGNDFRALDPNISPLRASLAVWGLTVDDIDFVSMHGTSTKANEKNECDIIQKQMTHLGRSSGQPLIATCQKSLTGHPKAPAAAWMLNGCLQILDTGIVPGNRNADNVDEALRKFDHLVFPTKSIKLREVKAFLLNSFGFGQKGGQIVGVAPRYLFATLKKHEYEAYVVKASKRQRTANRAYIEAILSNSIVKARSTTQYRTQDETTVLMDPLTRVCADLSNQLRFDPANLHGLSGIAAAKADSTGRSTPSEASSLLSSVGLVKSWIEQTTRAGPEMSSNVGVDVEELAGFASINPVFIARNYTDAELLLAGRAVDRHTTLAGKWSAKEAVFKSLGVPSKGAGASMKEIEILSLRGVPTVRLHGEARAAALEKGIQDIKVSVTHSDKTVMSVAVSVQGLGEPTY